MLWLIHECLPGLRSVFGAWNRPSLPLETIPGMRHRCRRVQLWPLAESCHTRGFSGGCQGGHRRTCAYLHMILRVLFSFESGYAFLSFQTVMRRQVAPMGFSGNHSYQWICLCPVGLFLIVVVGRIDSQSAHGGIGCFCWWDCADQQPPL